MRTGAALAAVFFLTLNPAIGKAETLYLPATVNFTDPSLIKEAILTDCNLPAKLVQFIKAYAIENGMTVEVVENGSLPRYEMKARRFKGRIDSSQITAE